MLAVERMRHGQNVPISARDNSSTKLTMLDKLVTYTGISCSVMESRARCAIFSTS